MQQSLETTLRLAELTESEYCGEVVYSDVCARCGRDTDPDYSADYACLCPHCAAEVGRELKAFLRCFGKAELLYIDDLLTGDNVWELSGREMFDGTDVPEREPETFFPYAVF